jgi:subtilase family serine protease
MILPNKTAARGTRRVRFRRLCQSVALSAAAFAASQPGVAAEGRYLAQSTPSFASQANYVRAEQPSTVMEISVWLSPRNRAELDALARDLYDAKSPSYRRWLRREDIAARFAPSADDVAAVRKFLESKNLTLVRTGPNNFYVRMRGTAADVERAFQVKLNYYNAGGTTLRANSADPYIDGSIADLVQSVAGLDTAQFAQHVISTPSAPQPRSAAQAASASASAASGDGFETVCFPGATSQSFTTVGTYPTATYKGNSYRSGTAGCAYSPANVYAAYGLKALYKEGYTGTGQTIVILDWCSSPTIQQDANAFSKKYGLPELTSSNFSIIYPVPSACAAPSVEINLDVEWAHAIAPGANIDLVVPASAQYQDTDEAWFYAINYALGNVISGSYGIPEDGVPGTEVVTEGLIAEIGAVSGISSNFSSGDGGSLCYQISGCTIELPAATPYSTAVGGVSLALDADGSIAFQTGWETYVSELISADTIYNPPLANGSRQFLFGSGGGSSRVFAKPAFQKGVPGKFRQTPDIAWLADPYTAVTVLISEEGQLPEQVWTSVGGTSVACPMFSALWAIANQEAGAPLGQAAQYLYTMPTGAITDVVPVTSATNVTAVIHESSTVTDSYDAADTMQIDPSLFGKYYSAMWDIPLEQDTAVALSFGAAYGSSVAKGWDDITGVGTPNPKAFADSFAPGTAAKK